ncbi:MAG TPA: type II toxin-antitoxin system HicB family antitoxin [Thermoanaerobaculia bacterium]|jgi:predicted RNase H-like HicB family nuclease|nr:type II toxin-antitoxin system HicB family antitoxin [Thermoanaerobaculia bacterium]
MKAVKFVHWKEQDFWLGYLQDYPDYMTQGETLEELKENLQDPVPGGHQPLRGW